MTPAVETLESISVRLQKMDALLDLFIMEYGTPTRKDAVLLTERDFSNIEVNLVTLHDMIDSASRETEAAINAAYQAAREGKLVTL